MNREQLQDLRKTTDERRRRLENERDAIYATSSRNVPRATDVWERIHEADQDRHKLAEDSQLSVSEIQQVVEQATRKREELRILRNQTSSEPVKGLCDIALGYADKLIILDRRYFGLWELPNIQTALSKDCSRFTKVMAGIERLTADDTEREKVMRLQRQQTDKAAEEAWVDTPQTEELQAKKWQWRR